MTQFSSVHVKFNVNTRSVTFKCHVCSCHGVSSEQKGNISRGKCGACFFVINSEPILWFNGSAHRTCINEMSKVQY